MLLPSHARRASSIRIPVYARWHIACFRNKSNHDSYGEIRLVADVTQVHSFLNTFVEATMGRQDNQSSDSRNSPGRNSDQQGKSAGGRSTPGDYSDPNARQGSGRSSQGRSSESNNQVANDDDDMTYGRQAYQGGDAGGRSSQSGNRQQGSQGRSSGKGRSQSDDE